jgi:hypothetical protein
VTTSLPKRRLDRRRLRPAGLPPSPSRKAAGASPFILLVAHIQGAVTAVVCIVLIVLACVLFISRITDTVDGHGGPISAASILLLVRVLACLAPPAPPERPRHAPAPDHHAPGRPDHPGSVSA